MDLGLETHPNILFVFLWWFWSDFVCMGDCLIEYILSVHSQPFPHKPTFADVRRLRHFSQIFLPHTPLAAHFVKTKTNETEPKRIADLFPYAV